MPSIAVYVPCYNVESTIGPVLEAIIGQTRKPDEILVIDDRSPDKMLDVVRRFPGVRIISHEVNKGLAAARNTAFEATNCDFVASLDGDAVPDADWLRRLEEKFSADAKLGIAGGRLVESQIFCAADRWRKAHMTQDWGAGIKRNPPFMFVRAQCGQRVGGYDESKRTNGEDSDFSKKAQAGRVRHHL